MAGTRPDPALGGVPTSPTKPRSPRVKARHSTTNKPRAHVPKSKHSKPSKVSSVGTHAPVNEPPLIYGRGPFKLPVETYDCRVWARRPDRDDVLTLQEIESITWDDSSSLMTGNLTLREPEWAEKLAIRDGHLLTCEVSANRRTWEPVWTMRVYEPTKSMATKQRSFQLANDLQRLRDSTDSFKFTKGTRKGGWRGDQVMRFIFDRYGVPVAPGGLPKLRCKITNWILTDQAPLDVLHSVLMRERTVTGRKYALRLDAHGRVVLSPYSRPRQLYVLGGELLDATYATTPHERFATALTVRTDVPQVVKKDKKGRNTAAFRKIAVSVQTPNGIKLHGVVHRNVYSPDANTAREAGDEGAQFLAAVARPARQFSVSMPLMPFLRRLDAVRFSLPEEGLHQIVYVSDVSHNVGSTSNTDAVLSFDDPFTDRKIDAIVGKLSDTAVVRARKTPKSKPKKPKKPKSATARTPKPRTPKPQRPDPGLGGVPTSPTQPKPRKTGGK